jgi:hypothetical protein
MTPSVRAVPRWIEGDPPRVRVSSCPFPERVQHASEHWIDGALAAGFEPVRGRPTLRLLPHHWKEGSRLLRELAGLSPVVILVPRSGGWSSERFRRVAATLQERMGLQPLELEVLCRHGRDSGVVAACLGLAAVVVGDAGGWSDVAAALGTAVVTVHGRSSPELHGPSSDLGAALFATCKRPDRHFPSSARDNRCLRCLRPRPVADMAEEVAARRWPWDWVSRVRAELFS